MPASIELNANWQEFAKKLGYFSDKMPTYAAQMIQDVNKLVIKDVRSELNARGYLDDKPMSFGQAAIGQNIISYGNKDFSGKIMVKRNAFIARFIECGADVKPRHAKYLAFWADGHWWRIKGYTLPARPFLRPVADAIWGSERSKVIMDNRLQKTIDKLFKE